MAQLSRVTQKIFCSTGTNQTAVFGTMKSGSPTYSTNIATLMGNTAWNSGWSGAIIAGKAPFMEEFNAIERVNTQQIAYILQSGIPEWDSGTDYYTGDIVKVVSSGVITVWGASANSTNKNPTSTTGYWTKYFDSTVPYLTQGLVSNCITNIPQDIKLELASDGTLTLKAGSIVTKPDGTQLEITADRSSTQTTNGTYLVIPTGGGGAISVTRISDTCSGPSDTLSGVANHIWFDTTNLVIYKYGSDGTTVSWTGCMPAGKITVSGGKITSIDTVFNGAGYIGHHAFVLPGISFLRANGKNADGTLASTLFTTTVLNIIEMDTSRKVLDLANNTSAEKSANWYEVETYDDIMKNVGLAKQYVKSENNVYFVSSQGIIALSQRTLLARFNYNGTSVTQFDIEPVVRMATVEMLDKKAGLSEDNAFTGTNTVPTQATTDNSTKIANTAFVKAAIAASDSAPRDITVLWGNNVDPVTYVASIDLSEAFTNFEKIAIRIGNENGNICKYVVQDTYWLDKALTDTGAIYGVSLADTGGANWDINSYNATTNPSTTTTFYTNNQSSVLYVIYGVNRKSS